MTYDLAVWKPGARDRQDPTEEFDLRSEESEARFPDSRPPAPELVRLADLLEARWPGDEPPWEDLRDSIDGDFLYLTMTYDDGSDVEEYAASTAPALGLLVYSPISGSVVAPR